MTALSKILPLGFLLIGVFLLMQVILPIISFQVWEIGQNYHHNLLVSPLSSTGSKVLGASLVNGIYIEERSNFPAFISSLKRETTAPYQQFSLSIPKIKVDNAAVKVDSNDLSDSLAHLPGSALPGEKGNVFISGHSALSSWFSLKVAVFQRLLDLQKGDEVVLNAGGTQFRYEVIDIKAIDPKDLSVVAPPEPLGRYLTLMTCVPPGLNFKRLIVLAKMI